MLTKSQERNRKAIECAAAELFLTGGYEATTMDMVAEVAHVSKATLYSHCKNKATLFEQVILTIGGEVPGDVADMPLENGAAPVLTSLASRLLSSMITPHSLAVVRTVAGLAPRLPQFGEALYVHAIAVKRSLAAGVLRRMSADGLIDLEDAEQAADTFLSLLTADFYLRKLLGLPEQEQLEQAVQRAVGQFLQTCRHPHTLR